MKALALLRSVLQAWSLVLLVVLTKLAATLVLGLTVSRQVAVFLGGHPLGELALLEGGAERLAEVAPKIWVHPGWPFASVVSYAVLLVVPHGALIARVSGAAPTAGSALRRAGSRTGLLLFTFVLALLSRVAAVTVGIASWPRFSGAGTVFLVVLVVVAWSFLEGFTCLLRGRALCLNERLGVALKCSYHLRSMARAGLLTVAHLVLQAAVGALTFTLAARAALQPPGLAVFLGCLCVATLALSTGLFGAVHTLMVWGVPASLSTPGSNGLPTSDQVGYEPARSVEESPGSSVGRAED